MMEDDGRAAISCMTAEPTAQWIAAATALAHM